MRPLKLSILPLFGLLAAGVVLTGCFNESGGDDPLVNPNVEAVLTTGQTTSGSSGTGTSGPGLLSINPPAVRIAVDQTMTFTAAGGEPPYTFSIISSPPNGTITTSGDYTAGSAAGSARVRVTDAANSVSDANVTIFDPATTPNYYQIVCTDITPPASAVVVPPNTMVNFQILNGTSPDSFNVTNQSGGSPQGFFVASRTGSWKTGGTGMDDGSIVDTLQVYDSSNPLNVATLKIYVCQTPLAITPTWAVVPTSSLGETFTASSTGVGILTWSVPTTVAQGGSGGLVNPTTGTSTTYQPGSNTNGTLGASDVVQVQDSFPNPAVAGVPNQVAQASVTVPGLDVYPKDVHVSPGTGVTLYALGGSGTYSWSVLQNRSGGTPSSGSSPTFIYTAGTAEGLDIIQLSDGTAGGNAQVEITVCQQVTTRTYKRLTSYFPSTGYIGQYCPYDMVVDDFDGNGADDVAVTFNSSQRNVYSDKSGNEVAVLMGQGGGAFAASSTKYTVPGTNPAPWGITSGDYNADGNRDLAVSCYTTGVVLVMFGDGNGGFPNTGQGNLNYITLNMPTGMGPTGITSYNFDRSNGDDLVVCDGLTGKVAVLLSKGGGAASPPAGFKTAIVLQVSDPNTTDSVLPMCMDVAVANFDNDQTGSSDLTGNARNGIGLVDIAVTDYAHDRVVVFPGSGIVSWNQTGQGSAAVWSGGGATSSRKPMGIAWGFFGATGDTSPDIVVANNGANGYSYGITVLNNNGTTGSISFGSLTEYGCGSYSRYWWDVVAYDLDNDGVDDIAATARNVRPDLGMGSATYYYGYSCLSVWRGRGNGAFYGWTSSSSTYGWRDYPYYRYWFPTALGVIDFGGQTHGSPGAPMADLVAANASHYNSYAHYGKLNVWENQSQ